MAKPPRYICQTAAFECQGRQFVTVEDGGVVRRRLLTTGEVVEEITCPPTRSGCGIEEIAVSPSSAWLIAQRFSGQGEWGYDVLRTCPLRREAVVLEEHGYMLDLPAFFEDESALVGGYGPQWLGGWWAHPDDEPDVPARGGLMPFGHLFVHHLASHRVVWHELGMKVPPGWLPEDPWAETWFGASKIKPVKAGIQLTLPGNIPYTIKAPLPPVILLPTPHPSGGRLLM